MCTKHVSKFPCSKYTDHLIFLHYFNLTSTLHCKKRPFTVAGSVPCCFIVIKEINLLSCIMHGKKAAAPYASMLVMSMPKTSRYFNFAIPRFYHYLILMGCNNRSTQKLDGEQT